MWKRDKCRPEKHRFLLGTVLYCLLVNSVYERIITVAISIEVPLRLRSNIIKNKIMLSYTSISVVRHYSKL